MQVHEPKSGAGEATTKPKRIRPTMASHRLDLPSICDICGKHRGTRKHDSCSRIRQQSKNEEWAFFMAEQCATRTAKQERRRYER